RSNLPARWPCPWVSCAPKRLVGLTAGLPSRDPNVLKLPVAHRRKHLPVTRPPPPDTDQGDPVAHLVCHAHYLSPSTGLSTRRRLELAFSWSQPMSKRQRDVSAKTVSSCVFWIASSGFGTSLTVRNLVNGHALTSADFMPTELVLLIILAGLTFTGLLRRQ